MSVRLGERRIERDGNAGQGFRYRAGVLCVLRCLDESVSVEAINLAADREFDAGEPESTGRIRTETHFRFGHQTGHRAAGFADDRGQLHGVASGVRGADQLLGAGDPTRFVSGPTWEGNVVGADARADQRHLAGAILQYTAPLGTCLASWHFKSPSSSEPLTSSGRFGPDIDGPAHPVGPGLQ